MAKIMINILWLFILSNLLISCTQDSYYPLKDGLDYLDTPQFYGPINEQFIERLSNLEPDETVITINSTGGTGRLSMRAANIIENSKITVIVDQYCLSACAEYLLPAAQEVIFKNDPLIGFHWNTLSLHQQINQKATKNLSFCDSIEIDKIESFYARKKINTEFWKLTYERISEPKIKLTYLDNACPKLEIIGVNHSLWFPSEETLKTDFGLKFSGSLCSDYQACFEVKIPKYLKGNATYVVGKTVFIVR